MGSAPERRGRLQWPDRHERQHRLHDRGSEPVQGLSDGQLSLGGPGRHERHRPHQDERNGVNSHLDRDQRFRPRPASVFVGPVAGDEQTEEISARNANTSSCRMWRTSLARLRPLCSGRVWQRREQVLQRLHSERLARCRSKPASAACCKSRVERSRSEPRGTSA